MKSGRNLKAFLITLGSLWTVGHNVYAADAKPVPLPDICKSAVNYFATLLQTPFYDDGSHASESAKSLSLSADKDRFSTKVRFLGYCDDAMETKHPKWCQVAGGTPSAFEVQVSENSTHAKTTADLLATVVVVYNRGGCTVRSVQRPE